MPEYPSSIPSTSTITRGTNLSGAGGGLSQSLYDDAVLGEVESIAVDLVGDGDPAGLKAGYGSLRERLDVENGRYEYVDSYSPAGNSLTPTHNLDTWFVEVIMQRTTDGVTVRPGYTATNKNGITISQADVPFTQGDSLRVLIRAL